MKNKEEIPSDILEGEELDGIPKDLEEAILDGRVVSKQVEDPMELVLLAAEMMDWRIAIPPEDDNGNIDGVVMGTQEFIEDTIVDLEGYTIAVGPNESENEEEI